MALTEASCYCDNTHSSELRCPLTMAVRVTCKTKFCLTCVASCGFSGPSECSRFWQNLPNRPVLKHGPRSLTYVRVFGWQTSMRNESEGRHQACWGQISFGFGRRVHDRPIRPLWWIWVRAYLLGPERWWTMPEQGEVRGNSDGSSKRYWRANRSSDLGIGAKD